MGTGPEVEKAAHYMMKTGESWEIEMEYGSSALQLMRTSAHWPQDSNQESHGVLPCFLDPIHKHPTHCSSHPFQSRRMMEVLVGQ